jgi:hypothetical protein
MGNADAVVCSLGGCIGNWSVGVRSGEMAKGDQSAACLLGARQKGVYFYDGVVAMHAEFSDGFVWFVLCGGGCGDDCLACWQRELVKVCFISLGWSTSC